MFLSLFSNANSNSGNIVINNDTILIILPGDERKIPGQIDLNDIINSIFNYNPPGDSIKYKGMGPFVSVVPVVGYTLQSGITASLGMSTSFYTDNQRNQFSNIVANISYSEYNQFWITLKSNIFLDKYKLHLFGDWRFYNFPRNTYGLGNHTSLSDALPIDYSYIRLYQYVYHEVFNHGFIGMGYNLDNHWNVKTKIDTGKIFNEFIKYQYGLRSVSSGISLNFLYDNRKNSLNPLNGTFITVQYRSNLAFLGSDNNWQSLLIDFRHYFRFPASSDNILAFWSYNNLTLNGEAPYLDMPSIGWDNYNNTGRGYVPGRFTGNNLFYAESEYRFHITRNGLFGGVVFCNAETLPGKPSDNPDAVIPGYGFGLRIKLNKLSDTNLSIDYGFGIGGSKGLFFNLGEVF